MKKIILILVFFASSGYAQIGYVEVNNPIYNFLDRMQSLHVIQNYNSFEIPKTRKVITKHINEIIAVKNKLNSIDAKTLNDFIVEFNFDLSFSTESYYSLFGDTTNSQFFNQKEKFI